MNLSNRAKYNLSVIATRAISLAFPLIGAALFAWGFDKYFGFPFLYGLPTIFAVLCVIELYEKDTLYRSFARRLIKRGDEQG